MREIELTQGQMALVDDEDFEELNQHKWHATWDGRHFYAVRTVRYGPRSEGKHDTIIMARVIMGAQPGEQVDHRDNEATLNNQRANLRICTHAQNMANSKKIAGCSSKYKGVCWYGQYGKWQAYIMVNYKMIHLGYFAKDKEDDAGRAYNVAALLHFGKFARLNIIEASVE